MQVAPTTGEVMAESLEEDYTYSGDDDDDDDDVDPNDYYGDECMEEDQEPVDEREPDPEYFEYKCLTVSEAKTLLSRQVEELCSKLKVCALCHIKHCIGALKVKRHAESVTVHLES